MANPQVPQSFEFPGKKIKPAPAVYREGGSGAGAGSDWRPQRRFKVNENWAFWDNPGNKTFSFKKSSERELERLHSG